MMFLVLLVGSGSAFAWPLQGDQEPTAPNFNPVVRVWSWMASLANAARAAIQGDPGSASGPAADWISFRSEDGGVAIDPNGGS